MWSGKMLSHLPDFKGGLEMRQEYPRSWLNHPMGWTSLHAACARHSAGRGRPNATTCPAAQGHPSWPSGSNGTMGKTIRKPSENYGKAIRKPHLRCFILLESRKSGWKTPVRSGVFSCVNRVSPALTGVFNMLEPTGWLGWTTKYGNPLI